MEMSVARRWQRLAHFQVSQPIRRDQRRNRANQMIAVAVQPGFTKLELTALLHKNHPEPDDRLWWQPDSG